MVACLAKLVSPFSVSATRKPIRANYVSQVAYCSCISFSGHNFNLYLIFSVIFGKLERKGIYWHFQLLDVTCYIYTIHQYRIYFQNTCTWVHNIIILLFLLCFNLFIKPRNELTEHIYRPQRSCGQGNVFTGVCLSTGGEGVCLSACWDAIPPRDQADPPRMENPPGWRPPGWRTPPDGEPPQDGEPPWMENPPRMENPPGSRLQHTVYERPVRILLECILVFVKNLQIFNRLVQFMFWHEETLNPAFKSEVTY